MTSECLDLFHDLFELEFLLVMLLHPRCCFLLTPSLDVSKRVSHLVDRCRQFLHFHFELGSIEVRWKLKTRMFLLFDHHCVWKRDIHS